MHCEGKLRLRSYNTRYCLIEVVTKAGLTVVFIFTLFFLFFFSARQKIDEDLQLLDRQIRLQSGEEVRIEGETPAQSYLATPMVNIFNNLYK